MLITGLYCTLCGNCHLSKDAWLRHLVTGGHQDLTRKELPYWDKIEKSCSLVVNSNLPMGKGDEKIIQHLSSVSNGSFVTDLVWWEEQPHVAFVRFRSPERAKEVMVSLEYQQFRIKPDQVCQVWEGGRMTSLEWNEFLPVHVSFDDGSSTLSEKMLTFVMYCSVCGDHHFERIEWLHHLLQKGHQRLARKEIRSWNESDRARVLVLFGKLPVGEDDKIIQYLSKDYDKFEVVTDFVWWPERNKIGFVQFMSVDIKNEVLSTLLDHQFGVGNEQFCLVSDGGTISDLEWNGLHPADSFEEDARELLQSQLSTTSSSQGRTPSGCLTPSPVVSPIKIFEEVEVDIATAAEGFDIIKGKQLSLCPNQNLKGHLSSIRKLIEISDEDFGVAQDVINRLKRIAKEEGGNHSEFLFRAILSRHWILKLKCPPFTDELSLVIFSYLESESVYDGAMNLKKLQEISKLFLSPGPGDKKGSCGRFLFSYPVQSTEAVPVPNSPDRGFIKYKIMVPGRRAPFKVTINTNPFFVVEAQVWKLVKYLCSFHPVCNPVLVVAFYWAQKNSVRVGSVKGTSRDLPAPCGLFWLLMFFFQKEGLIPPANYILEQPHKTQICWEKDVGFSTNAKLAAFWKAKPSKGEAVNNPDWKHDDDDDEQFAKQVFTLLYKFFLFCGTTLGNRNGWILNARDSQLLQVEDVMGTGDHSKLTQQQSEHADIRKTIVETGYQDKITILHPLSITWRISTGNADKAFAAMKTTGKKLKDYLDPPPSASAWSMENRKELNFTEFLKLLEV